MQNGREPSDWRPMRAVGSGAREIRIQQEGRAHRVIYVAKFAEAVYVLHAFEKKAARLPRKTLNWPAAGTNALPPIADASLL